MPRCTRSSSKRPRTEQSREQPPSSRHRPGGASQCPPSNPVDGVTGTPGVVGVMIDGLPACPNCLARAQPGSCGRPDYLGLLHLTTQTLSVESLKRNFRRMSFVYHPDNA